MDRLGFYLKTEPNRLANTPIVEAQLAWDIGKVLGLQVSNEKAMIDAISKVREVQDFALPREGGVVLGRIRVILRID